VRSERQTIGHLTAGDRDQWGVRGGSGDGEHVAYQGVVVMAAEGLGLQPLDRPDESSAHTLKRNVQHTALTCGDIRNKLTIQRGSSVRQSGFETDDPRRSPTPGRSCGNRSLPALRTPVRWALQPVEPRCECHLHAGPARSAEHEGRDHSAHESEEMPLPTNSVRLGNTPHRSEP
jgi:hypothetical protein